MSRRVASMLLAALLAVAVCVLAWPGHDPAAQDRDNILAPASSGHPAGTDALGRDRLVRTAGALLLGLAGATVAAAGTTAIAAGTGTLAALGPASLASAMLLVADVFLTLPWLFLLMIVRAGLPLNTSPMHSAAITFLLLAMLGWPACAHAVYRGARRLRFSAPMLHGRALGLRPAQLARLHILPHLRPLLLPQFLVCVPAFLVAEANLGTLGLGIAEPLPSWGAMLLEVGNSALLARSAWVLLPVGVLVTVLLLLEAIAAPRVHTGAEA